MTIWVDAHLSPRIESWLSATFDVTAIALRDVGLRDAEDEDIFRAARAVVAVVMTKDSGFPALQQRFGPPPQIIWLTCGNTADKRLQQIFTARFAEAKRLLESGEALVEMTGL